MEININTSTIQNLTSISRPGLTKSISYQELKKIPFLCLINTDKGLLTKEQAIQLKTGGQLLLKYHTF
jgi:ribosomal protein S8